MSAVFLAADAVRAGDPELEHAFRLRALGAGVLAGGLAAVGVIVLHSDAHRLFHGLVHTRRSDRADRVGARGRDGA